MNNKNKGLTLIIILLLLMIGMGFAYLNTSLNINGSTKIKGNTWDIHFNNVIVSKNTGSVVKSPVIDIDNPTSISYEVSLNKPGDIYEFSVDVVNGGSIDASLDSIVLSEIDDKIKNVLDYSFTYIDGSEVKKNDTLFVGAVKTLKVSICYKSNILNSELITSDLSTNFNITLNYIQSNTSSNVSSGSFENDSWDTVIYNVKNGLTSNYNVGDIKTMSIYHKDYRVRISNMSECLDDSMSGSSCGIIFEFVDVHHIGKMKDNNSVFGGWPMSDAYYYLNNDFYHLLPDVVSDNIVETKVISTLFEEDEHSTVSYDKIFLLSYNEVFGSGVEYTNQFTRQLDYYKNGSFIKYYDGAEYSTFLRTPLNSNEYFTTSGIISGGIGGFAPAFKFN